MKIVIFFCKVSGLFAFASYLIIKIMEFFRKMKLISYILISLSVSASAADFGTAERLFSRGETELCEKEIAALLDDKKLPEEQRARLLAMKEYLLASSPAGIAEAVKQAKETAAHPGWVTADLLSHAALLIRRAGDWKERGIPEYQELSDAAAALLGRARDNGSPETALRIVILQTENFNLNGEYLEPLPRIEEILRLYYPPSTLQGRNLPEGAIQLMILAGNQHVGSGVRSRDARAKTTALSQAAKYYLRVVGALKPNDPRYGELCDRLHSCREMLRLLGYDLPLPKGIRPQRAAQAVMIDEMLKNRRYHDVVLALTESKDPAMKIRYAAAAASCGKFDEAWIVAGAPGFQSGEPALLLMTARKFLAAGKKPEAAALFQLFLKEAPDSPDTAAAARQCAELLIDAGKFREAADTLLTLASVTKDSAVGEQARFLAAQCRYRGGEYAECLKLLDLLPATPERALLAGQAEMKRKRYPEAIRRLEPLLEKKDDPARSEVLKLLIRCGTEADAARAVAWAELLLHEDPANSEGTVYAGYLLDAYRKNRAEKEKFRTLGNWMARYQLGAPEAVPVILQCSTELPPSERDALLQKLLARDSFRDAELLVLMENLPDRKWKMEFFNRFAPKFADNPERCALFLGMAHLEFEERKYAEALKRCRTLLAAEKIWRYRETKLLEAQTLLNLKQDEDARRCLQELLQAPQTVAEKRQAAALLAPSWERSGEYGNAIATAWTAIPVDGKAESGDDAQVIAELLKLIIRNADKVGGAEDRRDAEEILNQLTAK